ncbi:MAG: dimethylsulfonioproprionate lyase family protein [Proteobacteria bacterium]|nr:dimethylsulfonioproprionate lyase family protein [Pseudomonadota bacterium]
MLGRDKNLQRFIDAAEAGIQARAADFPDAMLMATRVFSAMKDTGEADVKNAPARLDACRHLESAYSQARNGPDPIANLTDAFIAIEPALAWNRRPEAAQLAGDFFDNHANAIVVGKGGLEARQDVLIGVSLVAPAITYPRHHHPPEELYIVLSPGEWMQDDHPMVPKRSGDLVHNPPNVWHSMQAMKVPLLAIWCLWVGA